MCFCLRLICKISRIFPWKLAGETPENVRSNLLGHLDSHLQPLRIISGDYPELSLGLRAAIDVNVGYTVHFLWLLHNKKHCMFHWLIAFNVKQPYNRLLALVITLESSRALFPLAEFPFNTTLTTVLGAWSEQTALKRMTLWTVVFYQWQMSGLSLIQQSPIKTDLANKSWRPKCHSSVCSTERTNHSGGQTCVDRCGDCDLPHINTWNKQKCHISILFPTRFPSIWGWKRAHRFGAASSAAVNETSLWN